MYCKDLKRKNKKVRTFFFLNWDMKWKNLSWQVFESDMLIYLQWGYREWLREVDELWDYLFKKDKITAIIFWEMCNAIKIKTSFNHSIVQSTHFYSALIFCQAFCCVLRTKEWMRKYAGSILRGGKVYINNKCIMKFLIKFQYILQNVKGMFSWCKWDSEEIPSLGPRTLLLPQRCHRAPVLIWSSGPSP